MKIDWHKFTLYIVIVILLFAIWSLTFGNYWLNGGSEQITITTPEIKGTLQTDKPIIHTVIKPPIIKYINGKTIYKTFSDSLDQKLILASVKLVDSFKVANDSLKLKLFESLAVANDVNQTLENDTIKINANIKLLGTIEKIKLDYTIKPFKVTSNVKQYLLLGGIEAGSNQLLNEFRVKGNIQYLSPVKTLYSVSYSNDKIIWIGVSKKIFGFNREIKK